MKTPKILSQKIDYEDPFTKIYSLDVKLPDGRIVKKGFVERHDGVVAIVLDDKNNILLTDEWRIAYGRNILQLPAGSVDPNASERQRIKKMHDELREEIGFDAKNIKKIFTCVLSANIKDRIHFYLATNIFRSKKEGDPDEIIKVVKMPFNEAYKLFIEEKRETTTYTVLGILLAKQKLNL